MSTYQPEEHRMRARRLTDLRRRRLPSPTLPDPPDR